MYVQWEWLDHASYLIRAQEGGKVRYHDDEGEAELGEVGRGTEEARCEYNEERLINT